MKKHLLFIVSLIIIIYLPGCSHTSPESKNLEQLDHPIASGILAPGMGTLGLIQDNYVQVFYLNEHLKWIPDKLSQFVIPEENDGLFALGMGTLGVVNNARVNFFRLDAENQWKEEKRLAFEIPPRTQRIIPVRMPWDMGIIGIVSGKTVFFYYYDEGYGWSADETAAFRIPPGASQYFSLGNMTMAIIEGSRLGVYFLHPEGDWRLLEDLLLELPDGFEAVIPWEPGIIAILTGNRLDFFALDLVQGLWIEDEAMSFIIP